MITGASPKNGPQAGFPMGDPGSQSWLTLWKAYQDSQKALQTAGGATPGFGSLGYKGMSPGSGQPWQVGQGYQAAAASILSGSTDAQAALRKKYEAMLRSRGGGAGMALAENQRSTGNALHSAGVSPELTALLLGGQKTNYQTKLSSLLGEPEADYYGTLSELSKGTGTELAGLKENELGSLLNYLVGKASAKAAGHEGIGSVLGGAGGFLKALAAF